MSDTNSWNYYGNTGGLAVKSKYVQESNPAPVQNNPQPTAPDNVPDAGGTITDPAPAEEPQEAPIDTNS